MDNHSYVNSGTLNATSTTTPVNPQNTTRSHPDDNAAMVYYSQIPESSGVDNQQQKPGETTTEASGVYHLASDAQEGDRASHTYDLAYDSLRREDENNYYFSLQPEDSAANPKTNTPTNMVNNSLYKPK